MCPASRTLLRTLTYLLTYFSLFRSAAPRAMAVYPRGVTFQATFPVFLDIPNKIPSFRLWVLPDGFNSERFPLLNLRSWHIVQVELPIIAVAELQTRVIELDRR